MSGSQLDALCQAAMDRIVQHINRKAGQQVRRMREAWVRQRRSERGQAI